MELSSDFTLLGKLSSTEETGKLAFQSDYEQLFSIINQQLAPLLDVSDYKGRSSLKASIDSELEICQLILRYPTLASRTTVGVFPGKSREGLSFIKMLSGSRERPIYGKIRNLPCILYHSSERESISVTNNAGNVITLTPSELEEMLLLYKQEVKIEDILRSCSVTESLRFPNLNFVFFPAFAKRYAPDYKRLAGLCSSYFMFYSDLAERTMIPDSVIASKGNLFVVHLREHTAACRDLVGNLSKSYPALHFSPLAYDDVEKMLQASNHPTNNCVFCETLLSNILKLEVSQNSSELQHSNSAAILAEDSFQQEAEGSVKETLQSLRKAELDAADNARKVNNGLKKIRKDLMQSAFGLRNALLRTANESISSDLNPILLRAKYGDVCGDIILSALELKDYPLATMYITMLEKANHPEAFLYSLYYQKSRGEILSSTNLGKLNMAAPSNDTIIRGKVNFSSELKHNEDTRNRFASMLKSECTPEETYYRACQIESERGMDDALKVYRSAFQRGSHSAGKRLAEYYAQQGDYRSLKGCADRLIPEAALLYAQNCTQDNQRSKKITYLHIAVAQLHEPAIQYYGNMLYDELVGLDIAGRKVPERYLTIAVGLYKHMIDKGVYGAKTRFGVLLYLSGNYQAAKPYLDSGKDGKYYLGRMYAEGRGVAKDIDRAMRYLKESGTPPAWKLHNKLALKKEKEEERERKKAESSYSSSNSYSSSSSNYSSSSSGCFITSATCEAEGKPDDCDELTAFRRYRDETLLNSDAGRALVEEYYRIAPGIVDCIQNDPEHEKIYRYLYETYITPGYQLLTKGDGDAAKKLYCKGVLELAKRYGVSVSLDASILEPGIDL